MTGNVLIWRERERKKERRSERRLTAEPSHTPQTAGLCDE